MEYTRKELAQKIRNEYPNAYQDLDDDTLVDKYLKKYPNQRSKLVNGKSRLGWFKLLLWSIAIYGGLTIVDEKVTSLPLFNDLNSMIKSNFSSVGDSSVREVVNSGNSIREEENLNLVYLNNIIIDDELRYKLEKSSLFKAFSNLHPKTIYLSDDFQQICAAIISDPNPDPDKLNGTSCGYTDTRCEYCGINILGEYVTLQSVLKEVTGTTGLWGVYNPYEISASLYLSTISNKDVSIEDDEIKQAIKEGFNMGSQQKVEEAYRIICNIQIQYLEGERYQCQPKFVANTINKKFCSKKCKDLNDW